MKSGKDQSIRLVSDHIIRKYSQKSERMDHPELSAAS